MQSDYGSISGSDLMMRIAQHSRRDGDEITYSVLTQLYMEAY